MGDVYWSLHIPLASQLVKRFNIRVAVETGTYFGSGAVHLASLCERVYTIENDPLLHSFVSTYYNNISNVEFINDSSPIALKKILPAIETPVLFVLDAHWFHSSPRAEFSDGTQCPIVGELEAIENYCTTRSSSAIIIDDADMFLGALPAPFRSNEFPSIMLVIECVRRAFPSAAIDVLDDVIVAGPQGVEHVVADYLSWKERVGAPKK